ncbi:hypothetical protein F5J12DRAFT_179835 [Pisolithus orientalis]|uniref:uncharacterized protein n=1 Tax=Pisolithus orientalis TaxID=936130 RepID=UPI002224BE12|nr:uncharacterized protein F5J12DRAFT_179835 [Pisolithus orientalis]KAI6032646.1 hypothetical protein F5J12DRAFT_179835 [Pisolithus orientalis]
MGEVVNAIVAVAVIFFIFRWATSGSSSSNDERRSAAAALGFRPKPVTQEMVNHVHAVFPDVPPDNIRFDLLRTGSVELTSNKILERGFLEAPPAAYYTVYPPAEAPVPQPSSGLRPASASSMSSSAKQPSLIERYSLHDRLEGVVSAPEIEVGGKAKWEDTAEKREASLQERKAQMILAARQRMLAQRQKESASE